MLLCSPFDESKCHLGEWYIVNFNRNTIVAGHVDPEELGRELGVLRDWERLVPEGKESGR